MISAYVSAPSAKLSHAMTLCRALREAGVDVVSTWPERIVAQRDRGRMTDAEVPPDELRLELSKDLDELDQAEVHVHICGPSSGSHIEWGWSLRDRRESLGPWLIAVGTPRGFEIFADVVVPDFAAAVEAVRARGSR